ncbi:MAG: GSU2403 family nucleotidyltransferase fold protein [bacterium]
MNLKKIESVFFSVLEDINDYLPNLTLVGGWIPHIYSNFLWKTVVRKPVTTVDIDFGVDQSISSDYPKTIFEALSSLNYKERHMEIGKIFPVVLQKEKIPVEFITYPAADINAIKKMVGSQIHINKIDKFDFLLKHRISIKIHYLKNKKTYLVNCPKPSAFLYHKGATFIERDNIEKQAKDLYYIYFILRYAPDIGAILEEISAYRKREYLKSVSENINMFFERISSKGCLLVEEENGIDEYVDNLRQDIYERFKKLRKVLG